MAGKKRAKRPKALSDAEILEQLRANAYALLALQSVTAKETEDKAAPLPRKTRETVKENVKTKMQEEFSGPRPDQIDRQKKQTKSP